LVRELHRRDRERTGELFIEARIADIVIIFLSR